MAEISDGGPAFPVIANDSDRVPYSREPGMSLRDWFAGQALAGICASLSGVDVARLDQGVVNGRFSAAYRIADALLQSREATHG